MTNGKQRIREILDQLCEEAVAEYDWREKHIDQALDSIEEVMKEVLGEKENSTHIRRFQCPNYGNGCYDWCEQWKSNSTPPYCSSCGKKMKSVEYDEPNGIEYDRNELRSEQLGRWEKP